VAASRIDELRRRVQSDPASIAFAQLAEEYRRSGQTDEAVRVCREGLTRHPGYLSARVTLGRALLDLGQLEEARDELEFVVAEAPENLAAVRGLAEICHREGETAAALSYYQRALALARHDPEIEEIVQQLSRQVGAAAASPTNSLSFEEAHQELLSAAERLPVTAPQDMPSDAGRDGDQGSTAPFDFDRLVAALGSPAAPPQTEAAVAGFAAAVHIPDTPSLGADPFAALEAELRSNEAAHAEKVAPWSSLDGAASESVADDGDTADSPAPPPTAMAPSEAEVLADTLLTTPAETEASVEVESEAVAIVGPDLVVISDTAELAPTVGQETVADAPTTSSTSSPEGVLDELEGWLTTLQDRSSQ